MLIKRINDLTFEETAILLWGVTKNYKYEQLSDLSLLYTRLNDILHPKKDA